MLSMYGLANWLTGELVDWLIGELVDWLIGELVGYFGYWVNWFLV